MNLTDGLRRIGERLILPARAREDAGLVRYEIEGGNPAGLGLLAYLPRKLVSAPPIVVLLHGCGQSARGFLHASGWMDIADATGAILLAPEQAAENNVARCFNWFRPASAARDGDESASIVQAIATVLRRHQGDPARVFVVGLSAGGSMAAALLAGHPDIFAAGAAIAGLPVGCAHSVAEAMLRMASAGPVLPDDAWAARARASGPDGFTGPMPRLSVWQPAADHVVDPMNAELLARQWRVLSGLPEHPSTDTRPSPGLRRLAWDSHGRAAIELWSLAGLEHGYPVGARGAGDRWMLPAAIDATDEIARFFGLPSPQR